jgi:hypothetical protein
MAVDGPVHETWKLGYLTAGATYATERTSPRHKHFHSTLSSSAAPLAGRADQTGLLATVVPFSANTPNLHQGDLPPHPPPTRSTRPTGLR